MLGFSLGFYLEKRKDIFLSIRVLPLELLLDFSDALIKESVNASKKGTPFRAVKINLKFLFLGKHKL